MKMHFHICLIIICIITFTVAGCTSKQASFSFEVNGVAAKVSHFEAEYDGYVLTISAGREFPNLSHLSIFIFTNGPGTYTVAEHTFTYNNHHHFKGGNEAWYMVTGDQYTGANSILYTTNMNNTGTVILTSFDTEDKKVSGTFEFKAIQKEGGSGVMNLKGAFENLAFKQK